MNGLASGYKRNDYLASPFSRFDENIENYSNEFFNADDREMYETENYERVKPFLPKDKDVVGTTRLIPFQDTDEKFVPYDLQGESLYTNPPSQN